METPFVEPADCNNAQLAFLTTVYAIVLYQASGLISGGSELLMLVPAVAGLVGSIVLPILGAVPDGMMVLFSGVGPNAQETVAVGVGALAGSTVMLLTFPWFICILFGRVPLDDKGKPDWTDKDPNPPLLRSGISFQRSIQTNCKIMLATTLLYAVIQVPASFQELLGKGTKAQGSAEHRVALIGLFACCLAFVGYLVFCFIDANEDKQLAEIIKGIERKQISIAAALEFISKNTKANDGQEGLLQTEQMERVKKICKPFFRRYDYDKDHNLSSGELPPLLHDLGVELSVKDLMREQDTDGDGQVSFDEFTRYLYKFMLDRKLMDSAVKYSNPNLIRKAEAAQSCEDPDDVMPEDLREVEDPRMQQRRVIIRSMWMMALGTALVLAFSDPMVDCLSEWGNRMGVSAFYVSFVLAPFASNASELLSAYTYAKKKTEKNMTTSLSTLVGAACMNNTFVFAVFLALIYLQGLAWQFTAETIAMVLIQWIIGLTALISRRQNMVHALLILLCYPGCLLIVWFLENRVGLD